MKGLTPPNILKHGNVYDACDDAYSLEARLDEEVIAESTHHYRRKARNRVMVDPLAPDYTKIFLQRDTPWSPDEILELSKPLALRIPVKHRDEFGPDELPNSDLLRAIHYYAKTARLGQYSLDETALLAFGMVVELWADDLIGKAEALMFIAPDHESVNSGSPCTSGADIRQNIISSGDDSDVIMIEVESESDSDSPGNAGDQASDGATISENSASENSASDNSASDNSASDNSEDSGSESE